jgi:molybdenum cofactor cytidylyltransferase
MLAAAILAAGESRRMGTPKALLPYRGRTFAEYLVEAMTHPRVGIIRIVLGARAEELQEKLNAGEGSIVINDHWEKGQLSSIQAAIRSLPQGATEGVMICPVDHPLISAKLVNKLIEAFDSRADRIVLPTFKGRRGHPVIFHASLYDELLGASVNVGARQVVWAHEEEVLEVPTEEEGVILNLNDPAALKKAMMDEGK